MREIKFRGKRVDNGEWVYGNLVEDKDKHYYIVNDYEGSQLLMIIYKKL